MKINKRDVLVKSEGKSEKEKKEKQALAMQWLMQDGKDD